METNREIKKIHLDFEKTFPYFFDHIECGKTLSKKIVERVNFDQGSFFTLLPSNVELDRLFKFDEGIIPPVPYDNEITPVPDSRIYVIDFPYSNPPKYVIETMDLECSNFIFSYLKENNNNCSVIENYMLEPASPFVNIENVLSVFYNNDVNFILNNKNTVNEIYKIIKKSKQIWHMLIVLTKLENKIPKNLEIDDFDHICDNAKFIIGGAYDGESYIFWERKKLEL